MAGRAVRRDQVIYYQYRHDRARRTLRGIDDQKFVRTARRCKTIEIQAGAHTITAADPCPTTSATPRPRPPRPRCALV